ncbi:hypothetical protein GCM10022631_18170 [Deinococcus rubellus]|uniref:Uncharacterized protein n=1 Tax=Deinococcus rubellus TaxID=1889240 RepID=A0ABY5YFX5_9DEIO|nr:hypothetical protein [Deinococcus rubellus]UWX63616.1 hypothetical protein N0D28_12880 [Deinococcus rubellus]
MPHATNRAFLERRNALWLVLRQSGPLEAQANAETFEQAFAELSALTGWPRPQILAGLGLSEEDLRGGWPEQP